jgi:DNA-directed RNA polymerase specialized sigma24 family protein
MSDAFVHFYEQNVQDVYGYLIYRVGARAEAERLTQLTFERAAREWSTLRSDPDGDRLRLFRVAREAASTRRPTTGADDPGVAPDLATALAKLDRSERSVIALRWGANLAGPEIATVLGVSENTVRRRLSRGLRRLRTELDDGARSDPAGLGAGGGDREQAWAPRPGGDSPDA